MYDECRISILYVTWDLKKINMEHSKDRNFKLLKTATIAKIHIGMKRFEDLVKK